MFESKDLISVANTKMPFGKYKGQRLSRLPEAYLLWFDKKGFPTGRLGDLMKFSLEIKIHGLETLLYPLEQDTS